MRHGCGFQSDRGFTSVTFMLMMLVLIVISLLATRKMKLVPSGLQNAVEMAIEMLGAERAGKVVVCNAPLVEGAIMAATAASVGSSLAEVCEAAADAL